MLVVFPSDPFETTSPDATWVDEIKIAEQLGHKTVFVHWEGIVNEDDAPRAVHHVRRRERPTLALYRGWKLSTKDYAKLHAALVERNLWLINDPQQYATCHRFLDWYALAKGRTPRSVWVEGPDLDGAVRLVREDIRGPALIRDFVRSRKHEWADAYFISSTEDARRVIANFIERQGETLAGGLVVREFAKLMNLGKHPRSGSPMTLEWRVFWLDGEPVLTVPCWPEANYEAQATPPLNDFRSVVSNIDSRMFTMDIAQTDTGDWLLMEIGDGQVSGIPNQALTQFYTRLRIRK